MKFSKVKLHQIVEKNFNYNSRKIKSTKDIVEFINNFEELDKATEEITILVCLNTRGQILCYSEIAKGGTNYCNVDMKTIFKLVLLCNASKFILVHNHPSGNVEISYKDREVTQRIKKATDIMKIEFVDHIIIGHGNFNSCMKGLENMEKV